jgi:hypothetical protein
VRQDFGNSFCATEFFGITHGSVLSGKSQPRPMGAHPRKHLSLLPRSNGRTFRRSRSDCRLSFQCPTMTSQPMRDLRAHLAMRQCAICERFLAASRSPRFEWAFIHASLSMTSRSSHIHDQQVIPAKFAQPLKFEIRPYASRTPTHLSRPQWGPPPSRGVPERSRRAARLRSGPTRRRRTSAGRWA